MCINKPLPGPLFPLHTASFHEVIQTTVPSCNFLIKYVYVTSVPWPTQHQVPPLAQWRLQIHASQVSRISCNPSTENKFPSNCINNILRILKAYCKLLPCICVYRLQSGKLHSNQLADWMSNSMDMLLTWWISVMRYSIYRCVYWLTSMFGISGIDSNLKHLLYIFMHFWWVGCVYVCVKPCLKDQSSFPWSRIWTLWSILASLMCSKQTINHRTWHAWKLRLSSWNSIIGWNQYSNDII